jgi:hypothetical protein
VLSWVSRIGSQISRSLLEIEDRPNKSLLVRFEMNSCCSDILYPSVDGYRLASSRNSMVWCTQKRYLFLKHFLERAELSEKRATLEPQYSADAQELTLAQCSYREKAFKAEFIIVLKCFRTCNANKLSIRSCQESTTVVVFRSDF